MRCTFTTMLIQRACVILADAYRYCPGLIAGFGLAATPPFSSPPGTSRQPTAHRRSKLGPL